MENEAPNLLTALIKAFLFTLGIATLFYNMMRLAATTKPF